MCGYNTQLELNRIKSPSFCVFPVLGIVLPAFLIAVKKQIKGERVYFASYFMGMQSNKVRKTWYQEHKAIGHLTSMKRRGKSVVSCLFLFPLLFASGAQSIRLSLISRIGAP